MNIVRQISMLKIPPGDAVVAATTVRDVVVVVTARGAVFYIQREGHDI